MAFKKQKFPMMKLPAAPFIYPKLVEPDFGTDEYPMPDGKLSVSVRLTAEEAAPFIEQIDDLAAKSLATAIKGDKRDAGKKKKAPWTTKHLPYEAELDDDGDETGDFIIKANMRHSGINKKTDKKWSRLCPLFDAMGKPLDRKNLQIWGGTVGIVAFTFVPYAASAASGASVKLALEAVQITSLVNGESRDAEAFGFGEEVGYRAPEDDSNDDDGSETENETEDRSGDEAEGDF